MSLDNGSAFQARLGAVIACVVAAAIGPPVADAEQIAYDFEGAVGDAIGFAGVGPGDPISGTFRYDPDLLSLIAPADGSASGASLQFDGPVSIVLRAGGHSIAIEHGPGSSGAYVEDFSPGDGPDGSPGLSSWNAFGLFAYGDGDGDEPADPATALRLSLFDGTATALDGGAIPTTLALADFDDNEIIARVGGRFIRGRISSLTPATSAARVSSSPEPATIWTMLAGLAGLAAARACRRKGS